MQLSNFHFNSESAQKLRRMNVQKEHFDGEKWEQI